MVFQYQGDIALTPDLDEWYETERRPDLIVNDNNLFDTMTSLAGGTNSLGTVWNNWNDTWAGSVKEVNRQVSTSGNTQTTTITITTTQKYQQQQQQEQQQQQQQ